jgi:hypothetical protein
MRQKTTFSVLAAAVLSFAFCSCGLYSEDSRVKEGNELIAKIERFRSEKGRLPASLAELGIKEKEEGPLYYSKRGESDYVVWFGTTLGESVTYDSRSKKWQ